MGTPNNPVSSGVVPATVPGSPTQSSQSVSFRFQDILPPSALYIGRDDSLVVQGATSSTSEVVTINARLLLPNGRIEDNQFLLPLPSTRAVTVKTFALAEGFLLSLSATAAAAFSRGQTFLRIFLNRGSFGSGLPGQVLVADYVTTSAGAGYPGGRVLGPTEGTGVARNITAPTPLAGNDINLQMPLNARWRVTCGFATFTASATVANRNVQVQILQAAPVVSLTTNSVSITAGQVVNVTFAPNTPSTSILPLNQMIQIPQNLILDGTVLGLGVILTLTQNIQAGDQWSNINFLVEEWLDNV